MRAGLSEDGRTKVSRRLAGHGPQVPAPLGKQRDGTPAFAVTSTIWQWLMPGYRSLRVGDRSAPTPAGRKAEKPTPLSSEPEAEPNETGQAITSRPTLWYRTIHRFSRSRIVVQCVLHGIRAHGPSPQRRRLQPQLRGDLQRISARRPGLGRPQHQSDARQRPQVLLGQLLRHPPRRLETVRPIPCRTLEPGHELEHRHSTPLRGAGLLPAR